METRIRVLLLALLVLSTSGCASLHWPFHRHGKAAREASASNTPSPADEAAAANTASSETPPTVIEPQVERRKIKVPKIKRHNMEFGGYFGELSVEDFNSAPLLGLRFDYHITEDFFVQADYGRAKVNISAAELLGQFNLLSDAERRFTYYNASLGYNFLPGEVFLGRNTAMTSGLYVLGGIGSVRFAGDQKFSINFGVGFQVLPTDWLALHIEAQDLVFRSDLLGIDRLKNNLSANIGATAFF